MKHIRTRVFIQILLPTVIIFILFVGGGLYYVKRSYETQVIERKSKELDRAARAVHNWLVARISTLVQLSRTPLVQNGSAEQILRFLKDEKSRHSFSFENFYFIEPDGSFSDTAGRKGIMEDKTYVEVFLKEKRKFYYKGPVLDSPHFENSLVIAVPVESKGRLKAVLAATIPLSNFKRVVGYFTLDEFDSYMITNPKSIIIVHSNNEMIGKSERGEYGMSFFADKRLKDRMVFVSVLRTTWKLVAFSSLNTLLEPIRQIQRLILIFFLFIVLIISAVSLAISHRVARPIRRLTEGVNAIIEGNYRQILTLQTRDELQELAEAFNTLSERLVSLRTDDRFVFLGHVSARVAHEVRKPLHIIQLAAKNLEQQKEIDQRHVRMIQDEVSNADRFVGEILNFARPEELKLSRYSLVQLLEKVVRKYEYLLQEQEIEIEYRREEKEIHPIYMDIIKMEQAFSNLIENSLDAMQDSDERRLSVRLFKEGREAVVIVEDTGPGFAEESIDKLFDPYFTTKETGTGLGMSISYRIFTAHLARVSLENTEEHHARITVRIPL